MEWFTLYKGEKKSRFIATIEPVSSEEEAAGFIASIKKKYWDARHNCSAFVIGDNGEKTRCSDDGEPSGTAGRPMLDVLTGAHVTNVCVVVTRYFGGTLLGTGGLVRAYSSAVRECLENCVLIKKIHGSHVELECDYNDHGKIERLAVQKGYIIRDTCYGENVKFSFLTEDAQRLTEDIRDITSGRATIEDITTAVYSAVDGNVIVFENG